jgi:hypothetical protein
LDLTGPTTALRLRNRRSGQSPSSLGSAAPPLSGCYAPTPRCRKRACFSGCPVHRHSGFCPASWLPPSFADAVQAEPVPETSPRTACPGLPPALLPAELQVVTKPLGSFPRRNSPRCLYDPPPVPDQEHEGGLLGPGRNADLSALPLRGDSMGKRILHGEAAQAGKIAVRRP